VVNDVIGVVTSVEHHTETTHSALPETNY